MKLNLYFTKLTAAIRDLVKHDMLVKETYDMNRDAIKIYHTLSNYTKFRFEVESYRVSA